MTKASAQQVDSICVKNVGDGGTLAFTVLKRGVSSSVALEDIAALQVGSTDRFAGALAQRRITPGTVIITDDSATPQTVKDINSDGILWQTAGATGPAYPIQVGTVDYNEGLVDFTFLQTATVGTAGFDANYDHTDWSQFASNITFTVVAGGGERRYIVVPDNADNWFDGIRDETEIGFAAARNSASDAPSELAVSVTYFGDDANVTLPLIRGEIKDYPHHTA